MERINIYKNHIQCMGSHVLILFIDAGCTFLGAHYLASFVGVFSDFSYIEGYKIIVKLAVVFGIQMMCGYIKKRYWTAYKERQTNKLKCSIYEMYLSSFAKQDGESKLSVICEKDVSECVGFFVNIIPLAIQAVAGIVAYIVYFAMREDGIGVLMLLLALSFLQFLPPFITTKYFIQNYMLAGQEEELLHQEVISGLTGFFTIKMLNLQGWFTERYMKRQKSFQKIGERAAGTSSVQSALHSGVLLIQQLGLLVVGVFAVDRSLSSLETLIEAYVLSSSFYQYIARIGELKIKGGVCKAAEKRILSFLQSDSRQQIIQNLDMVLPQRGIWLVKGENGAGKSTLFSIISGYNASNNKIVQNGQVLSADMRMLMTGWCPQLYMQLSESFNELIAMIPDKAIDLNYLQECITQFGVNVELLQRPLNELSGGEQKKLMISLSLAKKGEMKLLDEPEVSLDKDGVECLKKLIEKEQSLIFLITHISTFDDIAMGIIQVKGGKIYVQDE